MSSKQTLAAAMQKASGKSVLVPQQQEPPPTSAAKTPVAPSRQGKKAVSGHFDPAVSRQLKQLALDLDTTVQALLAEALNDLFEKYGKKPLA